MRVPSLPIAAALLALAPSAWPATDWECSDAGFAGNGCGYATCRDVERTTADALFVLRSAVGGYYCSPCRCDADGSGIIGVTDALGILRAAVGQVAGLSCPACNELEIVASDATTIVDGIADDFVATQDGNLLVASLDGGSVLLRRFGPELAPIGNEEVIATGEQGLGGVLVCARTDGSRAVAWDAHVDMSFPPPHDYDDWSNVRFLAIGPDGQSTGLLEAHAPVKGSQSVRGILCRPDGGYTVVWKSANSAFRETSEGSITFYFVAGAPFNGVYSRAFDPMGAPLDAPQVVVRWSEWFAFWTRAIDAPGGRIVFSLNDRLIVADHAGVVLADQDLVFGTFFGSLLHACTAETGRCIAAGNDYGVRAFVYDPGLPAEILPILVRDAESEYVDPYWMKTEPFLGTLACDEAGICVVTWDLWRRRDVSPEESAEEEFVGTFGRAINVLTGDMGPEVLLPSWKVRNAGPGRFVSVEAGEPGTTVLRSLVVR